MNARAMRFEAIVVGGGLAGMMAALEIARRPKTRVALVSIAALGEATSSAWAQGGIAAAVGPGDAPALHAADTVAAGAGLVERRVAARLAADAPGAIERIASLGVRFDRDANHAYALGREAAHSRRRILRAGGDATGAELVRALGAAVRADPRVVVIEGARAHDVLVHDGRAAGLTLADARGATVVLQAPAIVLATGGLGGLYRYTTNPTSSRGSGIAIAARAGARLADLEFVQFHPTALDVSSDPLPLITEALRGEGATLVDAAGAPLAASVAGPLELAPRDIVARAVYATSQRGGRAFLDARHVAPDRFSERFPTVFAACARFAIDPRTMPIPVVAAAHYHMGGIAVDLAGRTNVPGLYACGEVAATGVHGANRLASNSLLESVVYPERIARAIAADSGNVAAPARPVSAIASTDRAVVSGGDRAREAREFAAIRDIMYRDVGVERTETGLARATRDLHAIGCAPASRDVRDAALVGALVAHAALRRRESRGSHARTDYPRIAGATGRRSYTMLADFTAARIA
ncbi:MAG: L-aspartate oxidase [Vulcanimicrobiaceae bacterium]